MLMMPILMMMMLMIRMIMMLIDNDAVEVDDNIEMILLMVD